MNRRQQSGLTLVELLIAALLGLIVVGALVAVFVSNSQNYRQNDAVASLQDNARFALDTLSRDLAMAGYWGGVRAADASTNVSVSASAAAAVSTTALPGDCGPATPAAGQHWLFNVSAPIEFHDHLDGTPITTLYRCLDHVAAHTDVVVIRRAAGQPAADLPSTWVADATLTPNRFYVKTNQNIASIIQATAALVNIATPTDCPGSGGLPVPCPPNGYPAQYLAYRPSIYYVRDYLNTVGDGLPILCRLYLDDSTTTPSMQEDCLAEGVENLQLEWGIDAVNNPPATVSRYVSAPTADQLQRALAVRIHLLVRSTASNVTVNQDSKSYVLGNYDSTQFPDFVAKGVLRRTFTTTIQLKNLQP